MQLLPKKDKSSACVTGIQVEGKHKNRYAQAKEEGNLGCLQLYDQG